VAVIRNFPEWVTNPEQVKSSDRIVLGWHVEKVNSFNYLGNLITYDKEVNVDNKLNKSLKITSIISNMFRPQKPLKKTRLKLYSILTVLCGSENWAIKTKDARRITAA
jgi:hypothetical protein